MFQYFWEHREENVMRCHAHITPHINDMNENPAKRRDASKFRPSAASLAGSRPDSLAARSLDQTSDLRAAFHVHFGPRLGQRQLSTARWHEPGLRAVSLDPAWHAKELQGLTVVTRRLLPCKRGQLIWRPGRSKRRMAFTKSSSVTLRHALRNGQKLSLRAGRTPGAPNPSTSTTPASCVSRKALG